MLYPKMLLSLVIFFTCLTAHGHEQSDQERSVIKSPIRGELQLEIGENVIASYIYGDPEIPRPYFKDVKTVGGIKVTRNHPPIRGTDRGDHSTMHPGIWMAFGDLDGADFWRNKAMVEHTRFLVPPTTSSTDASFTAENHYLRPNGSVICKEVFEFAVHLLSPSPNDPQGYLMTWDSTFSSDNLFFFGDQEEMGLGIRVATPLSELEGGQLLDSEGRVGASEIWSQSAKWCDYSGIIDDQHVGMTIFCHPENFRSSWMHARNYGFVAANPFGRHAMKKGKPSQVKVKPDQPLRLRYAIYVHSGEESKAKTIEAAFQKYMELSASTSE